MNFKIICINVPTDNNFIRYGKPFEYVLHPNINEICMTKYDWWYSATYESDEDDDIFIKTKRHPSGIWYPRFCFTTIDRFREEKIGKLLPKE